MNFRHNTHRQYIDLHTIMIFRQITQMVGLNIIIIFDKVIISRHNMQSVGLN